MNEFDIIKTEIDESLTRLKVLEEKGKEKILYYFDRICVQDFDKINMFNTTDLPF